MAQATAHPDRRLISSEDVQGTNVYGVGDEAIGEIDHLLIDKVSGRVVYAVMSFGGFLGLGHSHYPIPWSVLKYDTNLGGYRTGITEAQLRDAPEFSDDSWEDRDWEARTHQHTQGSHLLGHLSGPNFNRGVDNTASAGGGVVGMVRPIRRGRWPKNRRHLITFFTIR